jgi:hypothetical protein
MSLSGDIRAYVAQKFGEHEAGYLMLTHESLRAMLIGFCNQKAKYLLAEDDNKPIDMIMFCPQCRT